MVQETASPVINFDPSQRRFFEDDARVQVVNFHRQKGKDFTAAAKAVNDAIVSGHNWYITSVTQRQADATHKKCAKFVDAFKMLLNIQGKAAMEEREYEEWDDQFKHLFTRTARKIILPGGAEIEALPGKNPDTLAGLTGNVIFTEFGLFPNGGYEHWRTIFPLSTRGFQVIVISTPRGKKHKFYELCTDHESYSYHFCPLSKSVAEDGFLLTDNKGKPCTIEQFKRLYRDDAGYAREYECQFTGDLDALIPWAQLLSSQDGEIPARMLVVTNGSGWKDGFLEAIAKLPPGRIEWGWDVARRSDLSSLWGNLAGRDGKKRLAVLIIMKSCEFALQRHIITRAMNTRGGNVGCGDATGLGMDSNETLAALFPDRWEPVTFSVKTKSELGSAGRTAFMDGTQKLPAFMSDEQWKPVATDLYSLQCEPSGDAADKRLILSETENELLPDSHCDVAYSGLLSLRAGAMLGGKRGVLPEPEMEVPADWEVGS